LPGFFAIFEIFCVDPLRSFAFELCTAIVENLAFSRGFSNHEWTPIDANRSVQFAFIRAFFLIVCGCGFAALLTSVQISFIAGSSPDGCRSSVGGRQSMKAHEPEIRSEIESGRPFTLVTASGERVKVRSNEHIFWTGAFLLL
jgi:hypothetical protein